MYCYAGGGALRTKNVITYSESCFARGSARQGKWQDDLGSTYPLEVAPEEKYLLVRTKLHSHVGQRRQLGGLRLQEDRHGLG
jgi:hypothetical protein